MTSLLFLALLGMVTYNFFQFMLQQKKYKILPMVCFYVVTFGLVVLRLCWTFLYFRAEMSQRPYLFILPCTFKLALGLEQSWIIIELTIRFHLTSL